MKHTPGWHAVEFSQLAAPMSTRPAFSANARCIELEHVGQGNGRLLGWRNQQPDEVSKVAFRKGDVLFAKLRPYLKKAWLADFDGICSSEFWPLRAKPELCSNRFLKHFVLSELFTRATFVASGSKMPRADWSLVAEFPFSVPAPCEQVRIADILDEWDRASANLDALIEAKSRQKTGLSQQLLSGKLRLPRFRTHRWNTTQMADVLQRIFRPIDVGSSELLALVSIRRRLGGLFRRPDVLASEYKTQDLHAINTGDFLISKRQVVHGAWAIVEPEFDGALVSKEYAILVNRAPDLLDMRFFSWLAKTPRMLRLARVASTGVHIEKLIFDPDVFLREKIRIPANIKEQAAIAAVLDAAENELCLLRAERAALDEQKRGLMQQLLTGKVRPS